ncbi:MAG: hypothetical protein HLUCCA11_23650 [Phormidesmis priestleyi Ana]|uniref:Uncharacterized protein n=1 Tax=Phormidesmis priestleyi Ana TaxID=1666911 RepID=A0A0P8BD29_9CYAN|nr:MAG: hypothetical protein HLUCCA11_23650 [Phormidesmis priestleyi Ana]
MQLTFCKLEKEHALAILNWRYSFPYDYYNFDADMIQEDLHYLMMQKTTFGQS